MNRRPVLLAGARLPALDGIRGTAIVMVLAYHFVAIRVNPGTPVGLVTSALTNFGWAGVDLFFVLSGFLITGILLDTRGVDGYFRTFYARRSLRIFPLYYLTLACSLVVIAAAPAEVAAFRRVLTSLLTYTSNIVMARAGTTDAIPLYQNPTWSLAVEEQFYLVWPLLIAIVPRRFFGRACLVLALAGPIVRLWLVFGAHNGTAALRLMPARVDAFAIGGLVSHAARDGRRLDAPGWFRGQVAAGLILLALLVLHQADNYTGWPMLAVGLSAFAVFFAAAIVDALTAPSSFWGRLGRLRALQWIGGYAYGLYLWQGPVRLLLDRWALDPASLMRRFGMSENGSAFAYAAAGVSATFVAAVVSWHLVEAPINMLKRYFPYRDAAPAPRPGLTAIVPGP